MKISTVKTAGLHVAVQKKNGTLKAVRIYQMDKGKPQKLIIITEDGSIEKYSRH